MKTLQELGYEIADWFHGEFIYRKIGLKTEIVVNENDKTAMKTGEDFDADEFTLDELKAVVVLLEGSKCRH